VWLTATYMPVLYMYYHTEFGHSRSNRVGVSRLSQKIGDAGPRPFNMGHV